MIRVWASALDRLPDASSHSRRTGTREFMRRPRRRSEDRSEEHTSELQSQSNLVCRLLLEKKNTTQRRSMSLQSYRSINAQYRSSIVSSTSPHVHSCYSGTVDTRS